MSEFDDNPRPPRKLSEVIEECAVVSLATKQSFEELTEAEKAVADKRALHRENCRKGESLQHELHHAIIVFAEARVAAGNPPVEVLRPGPEQRDVLENSNPDREM